MKKVILVCMAAWLIIGVQSGMAAGKKINIATSEWLPYCGKFLPNYGIEPEIVSQAYQRMGYDVEFFFMAWNRVLREVEAGKYDAATSASFTEERAKKYFYSESYMESPIVFYKQKGSPISWRKLEDLKPYTIGIIKGYSYSPDFDKADFLHKVTSKSEALSFKKLILKQADLIVMDRFVGHYTITNKLPLYERKLVEIMKPPLYMDKLHLIFSKKTSDARKKLEDFNEGLKKIVKDGTLRRILTKNGLE